MISTERMIQGRFGEEDSKSGHEHTKVQLDI